MDWRRIVSKAAAEEGEDDKEAGNADRLAEGIADIIADAERGNAAEIERLKDRIAVIEQRMPKHVGQKAKAVTESDDRPKAERAYDGRDEAEDRKLRLLVDLRNDMEELRAAMIKLSGHVKALAEE